jgi:hypothetical protein
MLVAPYDRLYVELARFMPRERLVTDPLRTLAYCTDARFYRLVQRIVAIVESESDVAGLLAGCRAHGQRGEDRRDRREQRERGRALEPDPESGRSGRPVGALARFVTARARRRRGD